jgi:hypothetical protein
MWLDFRDAPDIAVQLGFVDPDAEADEKDDKGEHGTRLAP